MCQVAGPTASPPFPTIENRTAARADDVCFLCLSGTEAGPMNIPCACPSLWSHAKCLARWQLQQAGRDEEVCCRFCQSTLPTWAASFAESSHDDEEPGARTAAPAVMALVYNGRTVKLPCTSGPERAETFKREVRRIFDLADDVALDVTFEVKVPALVEAKSSKVCLKGFQAFDAASTVAQMCASKRAAHQSQSQQRSHRESGDASPLAGARSFGAMIAALLRPRRTPAPSA